MRLDYHLHPGYSLDAQGSVQEYCDRAMSLGLEAICLTTHYDIDPLHPRKAFVRLSTGEIPVGDPRWLEEYMAEIKEARKFYNRRGLFVGLGLEVTYFPGGASDFRNLRNSYPFDYYFGSVHALGTINIHDRKGIAYMNEHTVEEMCQEYYQLVHAAVATGLFDAVGHLDGYRKFGDDFYGPQLREVHQKYARPVLELMAKSRVALEINSASTFNALYEKEIVYGDIELVSLAREIGLELVTYGSDSHRPQDLAQGAERARRILLAAGYDRVYGFRNHQPFPLSL